MDLLTFAALLFQLDPPLQLTLTNSEEPAKINKLWVHDISEGAHKKVEDPCCLVQAFWSHLGCVEQYAMHSKK